MNRRRKIFVTGAVSALGFCCLGPPAQAQTQTQTFDVPSLGSPASFLTFEQFDDTVPCRILQEVRLSCDWTVSGDFSFTNDAEFDCTGTATLIHTEELVFPFPGGSIECSSGGDETVPIGPNLPPGGTDFFPGIIDITYTDSVSFTTDLSPFIGAGTVDARISSQLLVGLQVPCDNTNSTETVWTGTITLEYIFVVPESPVCTVTGDDRVCEGDSGTLTVMATGGAPPYTYLWSTGEMTDTITVSATDTYCCTVTDALGCVSDPCCFDFAINPNPTCEITGDARVCEGDSGTLTVMGLGGTPPYMYLWSTGEMTESISVSVPDTYCCTVTDANGCVSEPCCFDFDVNPNPACEISGPVRVCEGEVGTLMVTGLGGTPPYMYLWSTGEMTQSIQVSAPDTYCCTVTDANGCVSDPCCFDFAVNPNPTCEITGDERVCEGDSGTLTVMAMGGTPPYMYLWSTGDMTQSISVSTPGTYCCTVTDALGCVSEPCCFDFAVNPNPACEIVAPGLPQCDSSGNELMVVGVGGTPPYSFMWSLATSGGWSIDSGGNTDTITYTAGPDGSTATFSVTVTDANGCMSTMPCTLDLTCVPCIDIGDFVWLDEDGDGCQDPDEPGIPDVTVNLYSDCDMPVLVDTTMTDGSGLYFFEICEPGEYLVEFIGPDGLIETTPNACDDGMGGNDDESDSDCVDGVVCVMVTDDDFTIDCGFTTDCEVFCDLDFVEIPVGEGCTPGYWKQPHHFFAWTPPYTPETLFSDVFADAFPGLTLLDVLEQGGGDLIALGRHTVAALLNAASEGVDYGLTVDEVIALFNDAFASGEYYTLHEMFEDLNEQGCPLGNETGGGDDGDGVISLVEVSFGGTDGCVEVTAFIDIGCETIPVEDGQIVDVVCMPPDGGDGEGCTPGYWKQPHHFFAWSAPYTPDTLFGDVFDDAFPGKTLLDVLSQGGGGLYALGRHTAAALLNGASEGVYYGLTDQEVIELFNDVYPGGDYSALKYEFESLNEQGCPLGNDHGDPLTAVGNGTDFCSAEFVNGVLVIRSEMAVLVVVGTDAAGNEVFEECDLCEFIGQGGGEPLEIVAEIPPCPEDLNGDRIVDEADLEVIFAAWGSTEDNLADVTGDGIVNGDDLVQTVLRWGACD